MGKITSIESNKIAVLRFFYNLTPTVVTQPQYKPSVTVSGVVYGGTTGTQTASTVVGSVYGKSTQSGGFTVMGAQSTGNITIALAPGTYTVYAKSYKQMYYGLCPGEASATVIVAAPTLPPTDPGSGGTNPLDGLVNIQDYLTNMRFNNRWGEIDYINDGVIGVKCKIVNDYTGTTYEYIQVYLSTKESSGSYYARPDDISLALGYYYKQKTNRGIYSRQWAAETNGIFYDISGMTQYDVFGGKNGPIDIITFIDSMGPQWESSFLAKTSEDYLNEMQLGLEVCSCFPILFLPLTGANILIDLARGNTKEALMRAGLIVTVEVGGRLVFKVAGRLYEKLAGLSAAEMRPVVEAMAEAISRAARVSDEFAAAIRSGAMYGDDVTSTVATVALDAADTNIIGRGMNGIWRNNPSIVRTTLTNTDEIIAFYRRTLTDSYIDELVAANPSKFAGKNINSIKAEMAKLRAAIQKTKDAARAEGKFFENNPLEPSFESTWLVENCAEIWAVRDAILQGSKVDNIVLRSVTIRTGAVKPF